MLYEDVQLTTRRKTPEGMLRSGAVVTRAGEVEYDAAELGVGKKGDKVTVRRTLESLRHPETLDSLRGAPVTIGHPPGGVRAENYKELTVGSIIEPKISESGEVIADVFVGDGSAVRELESPNGKRQLSIGYGFHVEKGPDGVLETKGPIIANHVALVGEGRAGDTVRVLDAQEESEAMTPEQIAQVKTAVDEAIKGKDTATDRDAIIAAVTASMQPALDKVEEIHKSQLTAQDEAKTAEAKAAAEKAADTLVAETQASERARYAVLTDADPFLSDEQREKVKAEDTKTILVEALKDTIPDAENQSVEFLTGALAIAKTQAQNKSRPAPALPGGKAGVGPVRVHDQKTGADAASARDNYIKHLQDAHLGKAAS